MALITPWKTALWYLVSGITLNVDRAVATVVVIVPMEHKLN